MTTREPRPRTTAIERLLDLLPGSLGDDREIQAAAEAIEAEAAGGAGLNEERARLLHAEIHAFLTSAKVNAPPTVEGVLARIGEWNAMLAAAYGDAGGRR